MYFHIDVTFEMRTVLHGIHLFNDKSYKHRRHIYMKRKEGKRQQDSRETERECVRGIEHHREREKLALVVKLAIGEM